MARTHRPDPGHNGRPQHEEGHVYDTHRRLLLEPAGATHALEVLHQSIVGHLGTKKLLAKFREHYAIPRDQGLAEDVVRNCHRCQIGLSYRHKSVPLGQIPGDYPWHTRSVDIMGSFPMVGHHHFIITFLDIFSGYCILVPSADNTASMVA